MVQAMQELHSTGRAHCDVKSENLLLLMGENPIDLQCKLLDMDGSVVYSGRLLAHKEHDEHKLT